MTCDVCIVCRLSAKYQTWGLSFPFIDLWSGLSFLKEENGTRSLVSGAPTSFAVDELCDLGKAVSPLWALVPSPVEGDGRCSLRSLPKLTGHPHALRD